MKSEVSYTQTVPPAVVKRLDDIGVLRDVLLPCSIALVLMGCGTLSNGRGWGQDATLFPGQDRLRSAAAQALRDPATWGPAAGAAIFGLSDLDERVSRWASDNTPVFGSRDAAGKASDRLAAATNAGLWFTALATPGGEEPGVWWVSKLKGLGVEYAAVKATGLSTDGLKQWTGRERPDGSDHSSFPSRHSSSAFARATLGRRNVDSLALSHGKKAIMRAGLTTLAVGTAWARVEAQKHFPSDVLAGAALGHFIAAFVHDAFLGLDEDNRLTLSVAPSQTGLILAIEGRF